MVQRTLRWIAYAFARMLKTYEFCEAISISPGDKSIDPEAVPNVTDILRHCRSLIRLSLDGSSFEFAHFTVREFLNNLDNGKNDEFVRSNISEE